MNLIENLCNFELSKLLKELNVIQKSSFYWIEMKDNSEPFVYYGSVHCQLGSHYSAFTSDELLDILPCFIDTKKGVPYNNFWIEIHKRSAINIQYIVKYVCDTQGVDRYGNLASVTFGKRQFHDGILANALAKVLIYLIEEKLYQKIIPIQIDIL